LKAPCDGVHGVLRSAASQRIQAAPTPPAVPADRPRRPHARGRFSGLPGACAPGAHTCPTAGRPRGSGRRPRRTPCCQ
jgi:hypothetical protein